MGKLLKTAGSIASPMASLTKGAIKTVSHNAKDRHLDNLTTLTTQVTKLTDQAQQLDLATKKQLEEPAKENYLEPKKTAEKPEKGFFSRIFH